MKVEVPRCDRHDKWLGDHQQFWFVTNLPASRWTPTMIAALYRLRWAIERAFRQMKTMMRLDQVRSERPTVVFIFVAASLLSWAMGTRIVQELEMKLGIGRVSHDRIMACLVHLLPDLTVALYRDRAEAKVLLARSQAMFNREGRHPNPKQPRRVTTVFETIEAEAEILAGAA